MQNVKDVVQVNDLIFTDKFVDIYPYINGDGTFISLVAFRRSSDVISLLGRWPVERQDDGGYVLAENHNFQLRRAGYWVPNGDTILIHDHMLSWLKKAV